LYGTHVLERETDTVMRLLGLTHSLSDVDGVGRYAVAVVNQARHYCDDITVFLGRKHRGISKDFPEGILVRPVLPPDYFMYMSWPRFLIFLAASLPRVCLAARRADLIHCLCDYPFSVLAWLAGKATRKPVIISGHGTYSVAPFRYPLHGALIRRSYGGAGAVLFGSSFAKAKFEEHLRLPHVRVLDYGVDVSAYAGEVPPPFEKVKSPYILCVGEVKERKGYEISVRSFIEAGKVNTDLTFAVVGKYDTGSSYFQSLLSLLEDEGMRDRVLFLGNVSESEKHSLYSHCEAFILTPKESLEGGFEALGLVFLEAGACGVPVIGAHDSGAVCAIRDDENGFLIPPDRPEEGGKAILRILQDSELKRRLGDRGRQMAMARDWGRVGERLERIYTRLVSGEKPFRD
jgi:phosphatidylinositol alpha-1,6-mannosyltransferase